MVSLRLLLTLVFMLFVALLSSGGQINNYFISLALFGAAFVTVGFLVGHREGEKKLERGSTNSGNSHQ